MLKRAKKTDREFVEDLGLTPAQAGRVADRLERQQAKASPRRTLRRAAGITLTAADLKWLAERGISRARARQIAAKYMGA